MRICVVGLGKVGLPLAVQISSRGHVVVGCDTNSSVVKMVNRGESPIAGEDGLDRALQGGVASGRLRATTDTAAAVRQADAVIVIVPALLTADRQADLTAVEDAARDVGRGLNRGTLVVFETTLPVGATRERLGPILEGMSGLQVGVDFLLAFSPERVSSGRALRDLVTYPKVVGGVSEASGKAASKFYGEILDAEVITVASAETAELAKLMELTFRDVNIALANEFALCAQRAGVDIVQAILAANSQPYSAVHQPGVGVGGHCVPVNPWFLINGLGPTPMAELARKVNDGMASEAVGLLRDELGGLEGRTVLILGLSYRGNVKESYHSAAFLLADALSVEGASTLVHDPLFSAREIEDLGLRPTSLDPPPAVDAIVFQANHDQYKALDLKSFAGCRTLLDGRNALSPEAVRGSGLSYLGIGR